MFDESKHPRDENGRFTDGSGTGKTYRQNTSYADILAEDRKKNKIKLSKQEWALFYERIGKIKREGHSVRKMKNGNMIIPIETDDSSVLVVANGSYQTPKVIFTVRFESNEEMYKILEELEDT